MVCIQAVTYQRHHLCSVAVCAVCSAAKHAMPRWSFTWRQRLPELRGRGEGRVMTMRAGSYVCLEQEGYEYYCFGRLRALGH